MMWTAVGALLVSHRIAMANLSPITDCDEVYNYWEPAHFLHYGSGMQTWEYANEYALRTYAYVWPVSILSRFIALVMESLLSGGSADKVALFRILRSCLGALTGLCEVLLAHSIATSPLLRADGGDGNGSNKRGTSDAKSSRIISRSTFLAMTFLIVSAFNTGMFHSGGALLPSSTAMQLLMLSTWRSLRRDDAGAIFFGLLATLCTGWPFAAALFVPLGLRAVWSRAASVPSGAGGIRGGNERFLSVMRLLGRTALHAALIQLFVSVVDRYHYRRWTFPSINILTYNAASGGDELYGVEPFSYYVKNLLLNFNLVGMLAPLAFLLLAMRWLWFATGCSSREGGEDTAKREREIVSAKLFALSPLLLWLLMVCPRPHKEERFLFPVYPLICLAGAVAVEELANLLASAFTGGGAAKGRGGASPDSRRREAWKVLLAALILAPYAALSASRSAALSVHYLAPLKLYSTLHERILNRGGIGNDGAVASEDEENHPPFQVCVAGEWHRFPSSYFLPSNDDKGLATELAFLKSAFDGQLPQPFTPGLGSAATQEQLSQPFNDANQEEVSRYLPGGVVGCDYLVELLLVPIVDDEIGHVHRGEAEGLLHIKSDPAGGEGDWEEVASHPFLDAQRTKTIGRVLHLPLLSSAPSWLTSKWDDVAGVRYAKYALFERKRTRH